MKLIISVSTFKRIRSNYSIFFFSQALGSFSGFTLAYRWNDLELKANNEIRNMFAACGCISCGCFVCVRTPFFRAIIWIWYGIFRQNYSLPKEVKQFIVLKILHCFANCGFMLLVEFQVKYSGFCVIFLVSYHFLNAWENVILVRNRCNFTVFTVIIDLKYSWLHITYLSARKKKKKSKLANGSNFSRNFVLKLTHQLV